MEKNKIKIFTIGFTGSTAENFFFRLRQAGVRKVIDTRLWADTQLSGFAKKRDLLLSTPLAIWQKRTAWQAIFIIPLIFHHKKAEGRFGVWWSAFGEKGLSGEEMTAFGSCTGWPYPSAIRPKPQIYCAFEGYRPGAEIILSGKIGCVWRAWVPAFSNYNSFK